MGAKVRHDFIHNQSVQSVLLIVEGPGQRRLNFGLCLWSGCVWLVFAILDEGNTLVHFEVTVGTGHPIDDCEKLELEAGRQIGGRAILVGFVQVFDVTEVRRGLPGLRLLVD